MLPHTIADCPVLDFARLFGVAYSRPIYPPVPPCRKKTNDGCTQKCSSETETLTNERKWTRSLVENNESSSNRSLSEQEVDNKKTEKSRSEKVLDIKETAILHKWSEERLSEKEVDAKETAIPHKSSKKSIRKQVNTKETVIPAKSSKKRLRKQVNTKETANPHKSSKKSFSKQVNTKETVIPAKSSKKRLREQVDTKETAITAKSNKKRPIHQTRPSQKQPSQKKPSRGGGRDTKEAANMTRGLTYRSSGNWQVQVYFRGQSRYIGIFDTRERASEAFEAAYDIFESNKAGPMQKQGIQEVIELARTAALQD